MSGGIAGSASDVRRHGPERDAAEVQPDDRRRHEAARAGDDEDLPQLPVDRVRVRHARHARHDDEDRRDRGERELEPGLEHRSRHPGEQDQRADARARASGRAAARRSRRATRAPRRPRRARRTAASRRRARTRARPRSRAPRRRADRARGPARPGRRRTRRSRRSGRRPRAGASARSPGRRPAAPCRARVLAEDDPDEQAASLPRRPAGERRLHVRAQPVADATDPAPPADDAPALVAAEHDVHSATREPPALVEAGLGPTRRDRPRAQLEHGALRRRALRRELEQDPLADRARAEAVHLGRGRARRTAFSRPGPVTTTRADAGSPIVRRQDALLERVVPDRPPPEPGAGSATAASASLRRPAPTSAPATATAATAAARRAAAAPRSRRRCRARRADEQRGHPSRAAPASRRRTAPAGASRSLTASPGPAAARCGPGPIPGTSSRSSTERNGPCVVRQSTIFWAVTGPIPGSSSSCSTVALARLTFAPGTEAPAIAAGTRPRRAARHDHLLPVDERCGEVDGGEVCAFASALRRGRRRRRRVRRPSAGRGRVGARRRPRGRTSFGAASSERCRARPRGSTSAAPPSSAPRSRRCPRGAFRRSRAARGAARASMRQLCAREGDHLSSVTRQPVTGVCRLCAEIVTTPRCRARRQPVTARERAAYATRLTSRSGTTIVCAAPRRSGGRCTRSDASASATQLVLAPSPPAPAGGRAASRSPGRRSRRRPRRAGPGRPRATACSHSRACAEHAPTAPRRRAARTAGSATRPSRSRSAPRRRGSSSWTPLDLVDELHHRGDRRVELEAAQSMSSETFGDRPVRLARTSVAVGRRVDRAAGRDCSCASRQSRSRSRADALDARRRSTPCPLGRPHEEDVEAHGVGAVALDRLVGRDDVALRLRHLRAAAVDHPLVNRRANGSRKPTRPMSFITFVKKRAYSRCSTACSMPPMYWFDRQPVVGDLARSNGGLVVPRVGVAEEVPRRVDERVHRVRLAPRRAAARRAGRRDPVLGRRERRAPLRQVVVDLGQDAPAAGRRAPAPCRTRRSGRSGSGSPSSAGARAASRAAGSRSSPPRARAPRATR